MKQVTLQKLFIVLFNSQWDESDNQKSLVPHFVWLGTFLQSLPISLNAFYSFLKRIVITWIWIWCMLFGGGGECVWGLLLGVDVTDRAESFTKLHSRPEFSASFQWYKWLMSVNVILARGDKDLYLTAWLDLDYEIYKKWKEKEVHVPQDKKMKSWKTNICKLCCVQIVKVYIDNVSRLIL